MTGNGLLIGAVNAAAFMLSASFLAYVVSIVIPLVRHRSSEAGDASGFDWYFLLPCLNEERVIEESIRRLTSRFPVCQVWCVDDASSDQTGAILAGIAARDRRVHVVSRRLPDAQQGKGPALNAGWRALADSIPAGMDPERVIVGVVDGDGTLDPNCLEMISGPAFFGDRSVSAVQVKVRVGSDSPNGPRASRKARLLTRMQDLEFTCVIAAMQMLRRHVGSAGLGGNGQFTRLAALQRVADTYGTPWQRALIEDFELGLHILLTGGHTEYCHDTWVAQQGPPTFARLIRQRCRWAQGLMQCFRYLWPVLRSPVISTSAAMEITYFLFLPWFQLFGGVIYVASIMVLVYSAFALRGGPIHFLGGGVWGLIPLFFVFGLGPLALWGPIYRHTMAKELTRTQAIGLGLINWPYTYVHHLSTWWALSRMLRSRHDWKKTERVDLRGATPDVATAPPDRAGQVAGALAAARRPSRPSQLVKVQHGRVSAPPGAAPVLAVPVVVAGKVKVRQGGVKSNPAMMVKAHIRSASATTPEGDVAARSQRVCST